MENPKIAQKAPFSLELEKGVYFWCACGQSSKQPFCDGTHKKTDLTPIKFEIKEKRMVYLCGCKHSHNKPFCDSTHTKI